MLDQVIRGALVVDGTGQPGRRADIGVAGGRIVTVGRIDDPARVTLDAGGLVAAPGFVDPHTHFDAQLFWDPSASPSLEHGVTSLVSGNCGFTFAPMRDADADYLRRMMAVVEGMSLEALELGTPWSWHTSAEYLAALDGQVAVNVGFMLGHCALRLNVMGAAAIERAATEAEIGAMVGELHVGLDAGALGLSTTRSPSHVDANGAPVASRWSGQDELLALCAAVGEHDGTALEGAFQVSAGMFSEDEIRVMVAMTATARRPLNWNLLHVDPRRRDLVDHQLSASTRATAAGGRILALTMPMWAAMTLDFKTGIHIPSGWDDLMRLPAPERTAKMREAEVRQWMRTQAADLDHGVRGYRANYGRYLIGATFSPANDGLADRTVGDIAAERGTDPFDTLLDIVVEDDLRTLVWATPTEDEATWRYRAEVWEDERVLLGGSDAGAHIDRTCAGFYPSQLLAEAIRGHQVVSMERAVQLMTEAPASMYGLRGRGRIDTGYHADIVVFDPDTIGAGPPQLLDDLPGGNHRTYAPSKGIVSVLVNGVEAVRDGAWTGAQAGTVLRSGRDTTGTATS